MASINPTTLQCSGEPFTGKGACLKLTITSISDSDATTNKRYIGWKITFEGTPWVKLYKAYCTLGGQTLYDAEPLTTNWTAGQQLASGNNTYNNDGAGNLVLNAYLKQLFYYAYSETRWNNGTAQEASTNMTCSQLPRYANLTKYEISSTELNKFTVTWNADANCDRVQYSLDGGSWTTTSGTSFSIGNLTPGQSYNIKIKVRRTDSHLWTESGYLYPTCKSLPTTNKPSNFNLSSNLTASISSTSYLSKWYCDIYDGSTRIAQSGDVTNVSKEINLTNATMINQMLARHPNDNSWTITVKYYCVSNGTTYTLTQQTCSCVIPSGRYTPTFNNSNISYVVTDSQSLNITGSNKKVIKGISDIALTITPASPNGSATMKSYNATSGSSTASTTNISTPNMNLTNVDANSVTVQAVDSRNRTTNASVNYSTFIDYFAPIITSAAVNRIDGVGTNLQVSITGNYCNWSGLSTTNVLTQVALKYKLTSASQYDTISGVNLTINNNNGTFTITGNITGNHFDASKEYNVLLQFQDKISPLKYTTIIHTGEALIWRDMANKRVGIGKKPTTRFDVSGDVNIDGNGTAQKWIASHDLRIPKNSSDGYGLCNSDGMSIIRDHNNQNVTVDATGKVLFLGWRNTTGINILNSSATIDSNGNYSGSAAKWNGLEDDSNTVNTTDTWIPVYKSGKMQHTLRTIWSSKQHSNYNNNQDRLVTLSVLSYWNGAHNSNNSSNLTYAHQGEIQCKPTSLYDNADGSTGTITLSQSSANFTYLDIYFQFGATEGPYTGPVYGFSRIYSPNGKVATLNGTWIFNKTYGSTQTVTKQVLINANKITNKSYSAFNIQNNAACWSSYSNAIYITKVVGWK